MPDSAYKTCRGCGESQPLPRFEAHSQMGDGHLNFCRTCVSRKNRVRYLKNREARIKAAADWRRANPERALEANRQWKRKNARRVAESNKRSDERYPEKTLARRLLKEAVRVGRLDKPTACEDCDKRIDNPRLLHGHHEDYSKPYEVDWLCASCHMKRHHPRRD